MPFVAQLLIAAVINTLLAALAYKVHIGYKPIPFSPPDYWLRSGVCGIVATGLQALGGMAYAFLVVGADLAAPVAVGFLLVMYALVMVPFMLHLFQLESLADGVSVFLIFTFLPVFVLIVLFLVLGSLAFLVG